MQAEQRGHTQVRTYASTGHTAVSRKEADGVHTVVRVTPNKIMTDERKTKRQQIQDVRKKGEAGTMMDDQQLNRGGTQTLGVGLPDEKHLFRLPRLAKDAKGGRRL